MITVIEIDNKDLFNGAKVINRRGQEREIFVIPADKTISQVVNDGSFDMNKHVDYETVMLNKHLFTLKQE